MRLLSLQLTRYGPFADHRVCFDATPGRVNLLYAPNGAGKSVLRQAFGDLLFGIHGQSPMNFRFGYTGMRITAEAVAPDQTRFSFSRRKGVGNTLLDADGQADTTGRLAALLGQADRPLLERLFAIDTERLRVGGEELRASGGALGEALLSAGGLRGAKALYHALEATAEGLAPAKRSAQKPFYRALDTLQDARKKANAAVLRPDDWARRETELNEAEARQKQHNEAAAEASRRINQLQRSRRVRKPLAAQDAAAEWLASHPDAPSLPPAMEAKLADAVKKVALATYQLDQATTQHADVAKERDAIILEPTILNAAEAIERLGEQAGAVAKALTDIPQRQAERNVVATRIEAQLHRLNSDIRPDQAASLIPHRAAEKRARALIERHGALAAAVDGAPVKLTAIAQDIAEATAALEDLPVADDAAMLAPLVAEIQASGAPRARADEAARAVEASRSERDAALAQVGGWVGDAAGLIALHVLPAETYERLDLARRQSTTALSVACMRAKEAAERTGQAQTRLAAVIAGGGVADDITITRARQHRDQGWQLIYRLAFAGEALAQADIAGFAGEQPLPLAYQRAVQTADALADRRVLQADVIAEATAARHTLAEAEQALQAAQRDCQPASAQAADAERAWAEACASLPHDLTKARAPGLDEVRSFLLARSKVIERQRDLDRDEKAMHRLAALHAGWTARLAAALAPIDIPTLDGLLAEAQNRLAAAARTTEQRIALEARLRELRRTHEAGLAAQAEAQTRLESWQAEWRDSLLELGRPADETPLVTADILSGFNDLDQELREAGRLDVRLSDMATDNAKFAVAVAALLRTAAPDLQTSDALTATRLLRERLVEQQSRAARRAELQKILDQTARQVTQMRHRLTQSQGELLAIQSGIGAKSIEEAEQRLAASRERAAQQSALTEAEQRLRDDGDGVSLEQLRAELAEVPADDIAARLQAAETTMHAANAEAQAAVAQATELRGRMAQLAGDESYEGHIADHYAAVATIDRVLEEALLARLAGALLQRAMAAVEAQSGSALLGRISRYVRLLSSGAYTNVVTEDNAAGGLDLVMVPADLPHEHKQVDQLSEGTRDQLYLALRLAAIEDHVAIATPLPFIGDDILQTSDDTRATAALHALLELSKHVQVILLTHHPHIIHLARALPEGSRHVCEFIATQPSVEQFRPDRKPSG